MILCLGVYIRSKSTSPRLPTAVHTDRHLTFTFARPTAAPDTVDRESFMKST